MAADTTTGVGAPKTAPKAKAKAPNVDVTKDPAHVGDVAHVNCFRLKGPHSNHDAEVASCLTKLASLKFLQGPSANTENTFLYTSIALIVKRAAGASSDAAFSTRAEAGVSPTAAAFSAAKEDVVKLEADVEVVVDNSRSDEAEEAVARCAQFGVSGLARGEG